MRPILTTLVLAAASLAIATGDASAQAPPMQAGLWEISVQLVMPTMPFAMPAITTEQCITPEQLENPESVLPQGPKAGQMPGAQSNSHCAIRDYSLDGNTVTWVVECTMPEAMSDEGEMMVNYVANRVGACAP